MGWEVGRASLLVMGDVELEGVLMNVSSHVYIC